MGSMHPIYQRLLARFCREHGLPVKKILPMIAGEIAAGPDVVSLFKEHLGIPVSAWPYREPRLVSRTVSRYAERVTYAERRAILRNNGRQRRVYASPVHDVLDRLDWSVADFTRKISGEMRSKVSRASVQFWSVGRRQVNKQGKSVVHLVRAPLPVRLAAERVTTREAMKRRLGEEAILLRGNWPNLDS